MKTAKGRTGREFVRLLRAEIKASPMGSPVLVRSHRHGERRRSQKSHDPASEVSVLDRTARARCDVFGGRDASAPPYAGHCSAHWIHLEAVPVLGIRGRDGAMVSLRVVAAHPRPALALVRRRSSRAVDAPERASQMPLDRRSDAGHGEARGLACCSVGTPCVSHFDKLSAYTLRSWPELVAVCRGVEEIVKLERVEVVLEPVPVVGNCPPASGGIRSRPERL